MQNRFIAAAVLGMIALSIVVVLWLQAHRNQEQPRPAGNPVGKDAIEPHSTPPTVPAD